MDVQQQWLWGLGQQLNLTQDSEALAWLKVQDDFCLQKLKKHLGYYGYQVNQTAYLRRELFNLQFPILVVTQTEECLYVHSVNPTQICYETFNQLKAWVLWEDFETLAPRWVLDITKLSFPSASQGLSLQIIKFAWRQFLAVPSFTLFFSFLLIAYELFSLIEPVLLNFLIENLDVFGNRLELLILFVVISLLIILGLIIGLFRQKLWIFVLGKISNFLSDQLMGSFLAIPIAHQSQSSLSDDLSRIHLNEQVFYRLLQQVFYSVMDVLFLLIHFLVMCAYNFSFAVIDLAFLCLISLINYIGAKKYFVLSEKVLEKQAQYTGCLIELLKQLPIIKLFFKEPLFLQKWALARHHYWENYLANEWFSAKLEWLGLVLKKVNWMLTVAVSMYLVLSQQLTLGALIAYLTLKAQVFTRFEGGLKRLMQWQYLKAPLNRMSHLFSKRNHDNAGETVLMPRQSQALIEASGLEVHGLKFSDLVFREYKKYFIKGISGVGKTSLLKAIMGLVPLDSGKVFYQSKDCASDRWLSLHHNCIFIQQKEELFGAGLIENITLFDAQINQDCLQQVMEIMELSESHFEVEHFSAGQKQRVFLARALYQQPRCLILDEATCHLDADAELRILKRLLSLPMTMIVVNHRQGLESLFDQVIDLQTNLN